MPKHFVGQTANSSPRADSRHRIVVEHEVLKISSLLELFRSANCDAFSFDDLDSSSGLPCMHFPIHILMHLKIVARILIIRQQGRHQRQKRFQSHSSQTVENTRVPGEDSVMWMQHCADDWCLLCLADAAQLLSVHPDLYVSKSARFQ